MDTSRRSGSPLLRQPEERPAKALAAGSGVLLKTLHRRTIKSLNRRHERPRCSNEKSYRSASHSSASVAYVPEP